MRAVRWMAVVVALAAGTGVLNAQGTRLDVTATGGYMMPNNFNMAEYNRWGAGVEASWWQRTSGSEPWKALRRYPSFGVAASFLYIPEGPAGHRFGLAAGLRAPMWRRIEYYLMLGLSTYTKPYCLTHDPENIFIGPWVSCLIDIGLQCNITRRLSMKVSLVHTSNGNMYRPNKGLNYLQGGLTYAVVADGSSAGAEPGRRPDVAVGTRNEVAVTASHGLVMSRHLMQDGYYPCYDLSAAFLHYVSPVLAVGGGVDLWYNFSHTWQLPRYKDRYPLPLYAGLQAVSEAFWGPVCLRVGVGFIPLTSSRVGMRLYERVGAYYSLGHTYFGVGLNARAGMIEFVEWSVGYRIPV